jgi:LDH2 family malate/lactate/ureidoglycolate dehydrogenase
MAAPGSKGRVIGNNPFAYAAPAGREHPVMLDIAMSAAAGAKVEFAKWQGIPVPEGWMVDEEGLPTTDSSKFPDKMSLLPMAGHKGYGLALMVEILSAVLPGAGITSEVISRGAGVPDRRNSGHSFMAINIGAMMPIQEFKDRMDRMIQRIKRSPKAKGAERIYLPGEMEWEKREAALRTGIPLPEATLAALSKAAKLVHMDMGDLVR